MMNGKISFSIILLIIVFTACGEKDTAFRRYTQFHMNTYVTFTVPASTPEDVIEKGFSVIERWDKIISSNRGVSKISPDLTSLVKGSLEISQKTKGLYDPTVYPLVELWERYSEKLIPPPLSEIKKAQALVDWNKVKIVGDNVLIPKGMGLDFGGFAKGWVVDCAVRSLMENGVQSGIVDAGGDMVVWGDKVWRIGVKNPHKDGLIAIIKIKNKAIATSGDYENYFIAMDGKKYHHLLNPKTGYPAEDLNSVTVIAETAAIADGISTGLFIMGRSGIERIEDMGCEIILISSDYKYNTGGLDIEWLDP